MDCTTCKWDVKGIHCNQGHFRLHEIIKNCHGWQEKEKCECYNAEEYLTTWKTDRISKVFILTCKKCGRVIE